MTWDPAGVGGWELFAGMAGDDVGAVLSACQLRQLASGEMVARQDDGGDALLMVRSGRVEILQAMGGDVERVVESFGAGEVLGAMGFVDGSRQPAGARAAEATEVAILTRAAFDRVQRERPEVAAPFYRNLAAVLAGHLRVALELHRQAVQFAIEATGANALSLANLVEGLRIVEVHLAGGTSVSGKLLQLDRNPAGFTMVLKEASGKLSIIPYHAVVRIEVA